MKKSTLSICLILTAGISAAVSIPASVYDTSRPASVYAKDTAENVISDAQTTIQSTNPKATQAMDSNTRTQKASAKKTSAEKAQKRMLVYKGNLYIDTGELSTSPRCGVMDGKIEKTVSANKIPTKELQSNFGKYGFQYGKRSNRIEVCIKNTWHIFAYNENNLKGVSMKVSKNTARSAKLTISNTTNSDITFGEDYELEKLDSKTKEWEQVPYLINDAAFHSIGYEARKNKPVTWSVNWKTFHGTLKPGTYRIVKQFLDSKKAGDTAVYTLMAKFRVPAAQKS